MVLAQHFSVQEILRLVNGAADPNKSISSSGAQYVAQQKKIRMKENENMPVWLSKMVLAQYFLVHNREAAKRRSTLLITVSITVVLSNTTVQKSKF
jgi:hypothetical protein